jgi:colicin import membrane protein
VLAVLRRNPVALGLAILLHVALAVFLILEVDWRDPIKPIGADVVVVQATLVDQQKLEAVAEKKKSAEVEKAAAAERAKQEKLKKRRAEEKRKLAEIEKKREQRKQEEVRKKAEEQKRIEAEKVRLAEIKRKEEEKKQVEEKERKAELEKKRLLEEQKRKDEEAARQKAEAEAKAKKEAEAQKKAEAEAKEKAAAERKRKAEAKARADRKAREAELAAQIQAEQDASELQQTIALIQEKIERNWLRPVGTEGLKCELKVRLGSSGSVLSVRVVKSSGNSGFDRSVEAAVLKADPLPMPRSERLLSRFRGDVNFIFDPSN